MHQCGAHAINQHQPGGRFLNVTANLGQLVFIEEILQPAGRHDAEYRVLGQQVLLQGGIQLFRLKGQVIAVNHQHRLQAGQSLQQLLLVHAGVALHSEHPLAFGGGAQHGHDLRKALGQPRLGAVDLHVGVQYIITGSYFFPLETPPRFCCAYSIGVFLGHVNTFWLF